MTADTSNPVRHLGQVSRMERGVRPPTETFAQMCDKVFPGRDGWFQRYYQESRQWAATPPWFRDWIEHEQRAFNLQVWQPSSLSGLLQTQQYAHALLRTFPGATEEEISGRLAARMARQAILARECHGDRSRRFERRVGPPHAVCPRGPGAGNLAVQPQ